MSSTTEQRTAIEAYAARVVAEAPPLSPEQLDRIACIMHPKSRTYTHVPESPEVKALRDAQGNLAATKRAFAEAIAGCQGCTLSEKVHGYQKNHGLGYHDFVPLTPAEVIAVARSHGKRIANAERALAELTA